MSDTNVDQQMINDLTEPAAPVVKPSQPQPPADSVPAAPPSVSPEVVEAAKALLTKDTDEASAIAALKTLQKFSGLTDEQTRWLFERNQQREETPDVDTTPPAANNDIQALVAAELERMGVRPQSFEERIEQEANMRLADTREWLAEALDEGVEKALNEGAPKEFLSRVRDLDGAEKAANSEQFWKSAVMTKTKAILRSKLNASPDGRFSRKWVSEAIKQATQDVSEQINGMVGAAGRIGRSNADYSAYEQLLRKEEPKLDMAKASNRNGADAELKKFLREAGTHIVAKSLNSNVRV